jgi:hypothetical protein
MQRFVPGQPAVIDSASPVGRWAAVFEDDGDTGYLYALDLSSQAKGESPIEEALHIYNVKNVADRDQESVAVIIWSEDGQKACLLINNYPHAVVDFAGKRGYCRTNFPPPGRWKDHDFKWDENALDYFRKKG